MLRRRTFIIVTLLALCSSAGLKASAADFMVRVDVNGRQLEGAPLAWDSKTVMLLARDGQLHSFAPGDARNFAKTGSQFLSFSPGEMRGQLMQEFGQAFEVSGTGQYLVVHPRGQRDVWAGRFEELYRSFVHYFAVRGMQPQRAAFPLVAIVFYNRQDFFRYAAQNGIRVGPGVLGCYSADTNRILMYDPDEGRGDNALWQQAAETIIHEAAHQTAFNTGVHSRYAMPPHWVAEGLGTLFEAPGVWNSRLYPRQEDRINRYRLDEFRRLAGSRETGWLAQLVASDRQFARAPDAAYAEAWAASFFLSETRPRQYVALLEKTAARPAFSEYKQPERLKDFSDLFGGDLALLEAQLERFIAALP
jgi:hypothetical protein